MRLPDGGNANNVIGKSTLSPGAWYGKESRNGTQVLCGFILWVRAAHCSHNCKCVVATVSPSRWIFNAIAFHHHRGKLSTSLSIGRGQSWRVNRRTPTDLRHDSWPKPRSGQGG